MCCCWMFAIAPKSKPSSPLYRNPGPTSTSWSTTPDSAGALNKLYEGSIQDWEEMIDTNIKGLLYVTRALVPGMVGSAEKDTSSILAPSPDMRLTPNGNVYCATKAAVRAISEGLKQDLLGTPVRVSSVDPGLVETEFSEVRFRGDTERAETVLPESNAPCV